MLVSSEVGIAKSCIYRDDENCLSLGKFQILNVQQ